MRIQVTPTRWSASASAASWRTVTKVSPLAGDEGGGAKRGAILTSCKRCMAAAHIIRGDGAARDRPGDLSGYPGRRRAAELEDVVGLTHLSRVTVEGRAPITYLLPSCGGIVGDLLRSGHAVKRKESPLLRPGSAHRWCA